MNYAFTDIEDQREDYPDHTKQNFDSLENYLTIAKKTIRTFGPQLQISKNQINNLVNSEDAVSEIARHIMMADWKYQPHKGRTPHSWRNQCAKWALQDYIGLSKTKANKINQSLDMSIDENENVPLYSILVDQGTNNPLKLVNDADRKQRIKKYINFLLDNSNLTKIQKQCIKLYYIDSIESHAEIGEKMEPKITRQAVKQNIDRGLYRLSQTAKGTTKI